VDHQQCCEEEIDIVDYIKVIYKRRLMICIIMLISTVVVGFLSWRQPEMYEASATFFPLYSSTQIQSQGVIVKPGPDITDLIISVLKSRKMADRIIGQLDLKKVWGISLMADGRRIFEDTLDISLEKNGLIRLSVRTNAPQLSANIANAAVDSLEFFNKDLNLGAQRQIVQVIDRAVVPEKRMSRGTIKKMIVAGVASFIGAIFLVFILEFVQQSRLLTRLKEK